MRRIFCLLFALCLLTGCSTKPPEAPPAEELPSVNLSPEPPAEPPPEPAQPASASPAELEIVLPEEHLAALIVTTEFPDADPAGHRVPLLHVQERASVEALEQDYGSSEGGGFLFGILRLDRVGLEEHLLNDYGGMWVFARDQSHTYYYAMTHPTDVQFYRSGTASAEEWTAWETLSALGYEVCEAFRIRNGLASCRTADLYDHAFTYEGEHAYAVYYPYHTFDGSTAEQYALVLSQPATQGEGGVWCVERWYDECGTCYLNFPGNGVSSTEYYSALQAECDGGNHPDLLTPLGAARAFVENSYWFTKETTDENVVLTDGIDPDYAEANRLMSQTISSLLVQPEEVTNREILRCINKFTADTWGVMGRYFYGSDWWTPLQNALEKAAFGDDQIYDDQTYCNSCMMQFYLSSSGRYQDFIGDILQMQYAADSRSFDSALYDFDSVDEAILRDAVS